MAESSKRSIPPYVSYRSFWNFIDRLHEAIPARIDRSYWGDKFSGSTGSQLMSALRYLGLVDEEGIPTSLLRSLVAARDFQRDEIMAQIARNSYGFFFNGPVDYKTATYAQFEDLLNSSYRVNSDVARKCIKFFIDLATDARIPLSPFVIKKTRKQRTAPGTRKTRTKAVNPVETRAADVDNVMPNGITVDKLLISKFPSFDPSWSDELKLKWFEAFDELIRRIPPGL